MWLNIRMLTAQAGPDSTPFAFHRTKWSDEMSANFPNLELLASLLMITHIWEGPRTFWGSRDLEPDKTGAADSLDVV